MAIAANHFSIHERNVPGRVLRGIVLGFYAIGVPVLFALYYELEWKVAQFAIYFSVGLSLGYASLNYLNGCAIPRHHLVFFLYFLALALSTVASIGEVEPSQSFLQAKSLAATFILLSIFLGVHFIVRTRADISAALAFLDFGGLVIAASVYLALGLYYVSLGFGEVLVHGGGAIRAFGPLGDQVGFILILFVVRSLAHRNWPLFGVHLGALFLTATRGAFIALGIALVLMFALRASRLGKVRKRSFSALVVAGAIGLVLLIELGGFLVERFATPEEILHGVTSRLASMKLGLMVFDDNPILGVGFGGFQEVVWRYNPKAYFDVFLENYVSTAANQAVQTAAEGGAVGLVMLTLLLMAIVLQTRRVMKIVGPSHDNEIRSILIWMLAIVIGNQSAVWILPDSVLGYFFFLVAAIGCCTLRPGVGRGSQAARSPGPSLS